MIRPDLTDLHLDAAIPQPANFIPDSQVWNRYPDTALDIYLSQGWFRSQGTMFITYFMCMDEAINSIVPLRIVLDDYTMSKSLVKRLRRMDDFSFSVVPFFPDAEFFDLLQQYEKYEAFGYQLDQFESYRVFPPLFHTKALQIRHEGRLVACGLLDLGRKAAMGILNIYHPDYARYSPGMLLIATKLNWCRHNRFTYFYPGYFVPGNYRFDYKLTLAPQATEYIDFLTGTWKPIAEKPDAWPADTIRTRLQHLRDSLASTGRVMFLAENRAACYIHPLGSLIAQFEWPFYLSDYPLRPPENEKIISYNPLKKAFEESDVMWLNHPLLSNEYAGDADSRLMLVQRTRPFNP